MQFAFDRDQRELADAVRQVLEGELSSAQRQRAGAAPTVRRGQLWQKLAELGVFGLLVGEEYGGLGMSEVDCVLVLEELGRAAAVGPVAETFFIAAPVLARLSDVDESWLSGLSAGEVALSAGAELFPDGDVADLLLVVRGDGVEVVSTDGVDLQPQPGVDRSRLLFSLPPRPAGSASASGQADRDLVREVQDRGALASAAQLLGAAEHVLDAAVAYALQRKQFGRFIGSYQAVKHLLANVAIAIAFARPLVYRAAYAFSGEEPTITLDAAAAKVAAADAAELAASTALQVHGAIGYTEELDLQVWLKRIWSLIASWGDSSVHRSRVADLVLAQGSSQSAE
jgi:alkylation response protein AidB-like acyl-CoA dehydrogenase